MRLLCLVLLSLVPSLSSPSPSSEVETGRFLNIPFPLLPPYFNTDFAANFNKLKGAGDTAFFLVRDSVVYMMINVLWAGIHTLFWDGEVSTTQDIMASLLSPGVAVELSTPARSSLPLAASPNSAEERFTFNSLSELSATKLWNFFADPNPSTRNLYLNIGWALAQQILWILPTFFGTIPDTNRRAEDRLTGLPTNLASADPVALWNRLLSPQGVLQNLAINTLSMLGKIIFWAFMSSVPDLPADSVITGRNLEHEDLSFSEKLADDFMSSINLNVRTVIHRLEQEERQRIEQEGLGG